MGGQGKECGKQLRRFAGTTWSAVKHECQPANLFLFWNTCIAMNRDERIKEMTDYQPLNLKLFCYAEFLLGDPRWFDHGLLRSEDAP